jgi:predicted nucleic acid-binding protein
VSSRYLVDTNILLRFLTGEPHKQASAVRRFFNQAEEQGGVLEISPVVVAETIYTLRSFYEVDREEAITKVQALLRHRCLRVRDEAQVFSALERIRTANVGFADAFLAAGGAAENVPVLSFDRDLDKFKDVQRVEPV